MTTPELEAVARAIYEAQPNKPKWDILKSWAQKRDAFPPGTIGHKVYQSRGMEDFDDARATLDTYYAMARAALLAIREPTEGMLEAVDTSNPDGSNYVEDEWQAMIDHILGGKT